MVTTIIVAALSFLVGCTVGLRRGRSRHVDGLPCPNTPCTNVLPRRGLWSHATSEWAVESCPVCDCAIQYRSYHPRSHVTHEDDCYVRCAAPKAEAT